VIDLHCHVLPDVDDGVRTIADALELVRAAEAEGVTTIAATPHVRDDYPTDAATMEARVVELNAALERESVDVEILRGGELSLEHISRLADDELRRFGLGGNPNLLLVEFPYYGWPVELAETVLELLRRGVVPLLAHPERSSASRDEPERLRPLVDAGAFVQLTAASVDGRLGPSAQVGAEQLLDLELAHVIASDAHHPQVRAVGMSAARDAIGDEALGAWLTEVVPRALVAGEPPPPRPARRILER
jgi:protein-tyrosine phosphatase